MWIRLKGVYDLSIANSGNEPYVEDGEAAAEGGSEETASEDAKF